MIAFGTPIGKRQISNRIPGGRMTAAAQVSDIYPRLFYRDAPAAIEWLERAFGFAPRLIVPGPDNSVRHGEMSLGSSVIMVSTARADRGWVSPRDLTGVNQLVCMYVDNVDAHYARARTAGAEMIDELHGSDYGARSYECRDPEGNVWSFGDYRPGGFWEGSAIKSGAAQ